MSLITRCPTCGTRFRVVPDQLKISDGWVRCGHCSEVFDARADIQDAGPAPAAPAPSAPSAPVPAPPAVPAASSTPVAPSGTGFAPTVIDEEPPPEPVLPPVSPSPAPSDVQSEATAQAPSVDFSQAPAAAASDPRIEPTLDDAPPPPPAAGAEPGLVPEPATPGPASAPEIPATAAAADTAAAAAATAAGVRPDDVSFVRQARRRAFWRRPWVRGAQVAIALGLLLALLGQLAFTHRDRLAAHLPGLRPVLGWLCQPPACRIGPPRRIESVAIDSSSFARLRPDAYRLVVTLTNQSPVDVAMPALELTLTDTQDQPVLRRVLGAAELGPDAPSVLAAQAEWTVTLTLAVAPGPATARIAGYRLLAFYP